MFVYFKRVSNNDQCCPSSLWFLRCSLDVSFKRCLVKMLGVFRHVLMVLFEDVLFQLR